MHSQWETLANDTCRCDGHLKQDKHSSLVVFGDKFESLICLTLTETNPHRALEGQDSLRQGQRVTVHSTLEKSEFT